jgi:hypothetical protein
MAKQTTTLLIDDLDGRAADETVRFALDGQELEIDLSKSNANKLRRAMAEYVSHARKVPSSNGRRRRGSGGQTARRDREQIQAIRAWGAANGYEVSSRGRIPASLQEAYDAAH